MKKFTPWAVVALMFAGLLYSNVQASPDPSGTVSALKRRVSALEIGHDRQRRQIIDLRNRVEVLEDFRTNTNNSIQLLLDRTSQLNSNGAYAGTVSNQQVRLVNSCPEQWGYSYWRGGTLSHESYNC